MQWPRLLEAESVTRLKQVLYESERDLQWSTWTDYALRTDPQTLI